MSEPKELFREDALDALNAGESAEGAPLRLMPKWATWVYWFIVAAVLTAGEFAVLAPVYDYAEGRAVVQMEGRLDITTSTGGTTIDVAVRPGQRVAAGQLLVRFYTGAEQQELDRADREFELKLVRVLQDPADEQARHALATLRAQRELASARLRERSAFAPVAGIVINLRVRQGQSLAPGEVVATLGSDRGNQSYSVVAFVPGQFRPMIQPGMLMRLELDGYPHVYTDVFVDVVGDEAVGPAEARRFLGPELGDALAMQGSLLLVRGHLNEQTFQFDHETYRYYDGIPGRVSVRVRSMRLIMMLFPYLREVFGYEQRPAT